MPAIDDAEIDLIPRRRYDHVFKALTERPWAIQPSMLRLMAELLDFRQSGGAFNAEQIAERLAAARSDNGDRSGAARAGSVAVIPMYGVISQRQSLMSDTSGGTSVEQMRNDLRTALADPQVQAIVFDIDSPGGSTDGIPEFAAELRSLRDGAKPITAQVNTLAASAAYWLATSMTEIVATQSGEVGSIGVFAIHEDISRAADAAGVTTTLISAGKYKVEGNQFEPLTDEARAAMQGQVDDFYAMFRADVAEGRKVPVSTVDADYGQGRTLLAAAAKEAGMVDRIATLEQTVTRLQSRRPAAVPARASVIPLPTNRAAGIPDPAWNQRMKGLLAR